MTSFQTALYPPKYSDCPFPAEWLRSQDRCSRKQTTKNQSLYFYRYDASIDAGHLDVTASREHLGNQETLSMTRSFCLQNSFEIPHWRITTGLFKNSTADTHQGRTRFVFSVPLVFSRTLLF